MTDLEKCQAEIERCEAMILTVESASEMEGVLQGLQDWHAELRLLSDPGARA